MTTNCLAHVCVGSVNFFKTVPSWWFNSPYGNFNWCCLRKSTESLWLWSHSSDTQEQSYIQFEIEPLAFADLPNNLNTIICNIRKIFLESLHWRKSTLWSMHYYDWSVHSSNTVLVFIQEKICKIFLIIKAVIWNYFEKSKPSLLRVSENRLVFNGNCLASILFTTFITEVDTTVLFINSKVFCVWCCTEHHLFRGSCMFRRSTVITYTSKYRPTSPFT